MEHIPDALSFFSSITLHGLTSSRENGDSQLLILFRNQSFPPKRYRWIEQEECPTETDAEWESLCVPVGKAHGEFELLERLSEGRISIVYAARLLCVRQCPDGDLLEPNSMFCQLPEHFCVKLAKAEFIRSLARDAWFYEQLAKEDGYQGVITPVCFGFFTAPLPDSLEIDAWSKMKCIPHKHDHELVYDRYNDDEEQDSNAYTSDQRTYRENCPWLLKQWISRTDCSPIVGVLISERLGEHLPLKLEGLNELSAESFQDIMHILDDLCAAGIMHCDVKFNNFLRPAFFSSSSPSTPSPTSSSSYGPLSQICPRHKRIHLWRVIDFDRSLKWGKSIPEDVELFTEMQRVNFKYDPERFWGDNI